MGKDCTNDNCDRRGAYLTAATDLLVSDLEWMTKQQGAEGETRAQTVEGLVEVILTGMGSLSYGEQADQRMRMRLGLGWG